MRPQRRAVKALLAVGGCAAVVAAVGVASAAIPDGQGMIHACYKTEGGQLRAIDAGSCNPSETSLEWSQAGPQGVPGVQGAPGPKGDPGPPGAPGVSGLASVIRVQKTFQTSGSGIGGDVDCPAGTIVLGGGASGDPGMDLWQSAPADNVGLAPEAWHVFVFNDTASGTWSFTGYAICGSG